MYIYDSIGFGRVKNESNIFQQPYNITKIRYRSKTNYFNFVLIRRSYTLQTRVETLTEGIRRTKRINISFVPMSL